MKTSKTHLKRALLILLICWVGLANAIAQSFTVGDLNYYVNDDGTTVTVTDHVNGTSATGLLVIPESVTYEGTTYAVTEIGDWAFGNCWGLTGSLTIPNSVTSIGGYAFADCNGFTGSLIIGNSVTTIYDGAFYGCWGFTGSLILGNSVTTIGNSAFSYCSGFSGNLTIPNSVTTIGNSAFSNCSSFTGDLVIPNSVTTIGESAFSYCSDFTGSLTLPNAVTTIGASAFSGCSDFTGDLVIPNSVTTIGESAFSRCSGFTGSLTLPNSLTWIGNYAFFHFSGVTMTVLAETPPSLSNHVFSNVPKDIPVYVPSGTIKAYQNAYGWNEFTNYHEIDGPLPPTDYISDGLIMYLDGINNTRNGHSTTTDVWEDLMGNYDLTISNYSSYTWENNHFIGFGDGGYLNTGYTWQYFNSLNDDITFEIVTYIDCDKTSPGYRGLVGWHSDNDGTNCQNDQGYNRMQTLGELPVSDADDQIATVSYTRHNGSFLNGVWKTNANTIPSGINSNQTVVFGNSWAQCRGWNDSIYCIRMYNRTLTPEEVAYNHSIDVERFGAGNGGSTPIDDFVFNTYVDEDVYAMNSIIPIHGTVMDGQNVPAANVGVEIGVFVMGMKRTLQTATNEDGQFSATFEPMPSESGYYTVNSGRVGNHSTSIHDGFNIPGMAVIADSYILCPVTQNQPKTDSIRIRNKCNLELNDIQVSVLSAPEGCSISFMPLSLSGLETDYLVYTVNGTELTQGNYYQEIKLKATSNIGAETNFSIWYYCMEPKGILNVAPNNIATTMTKGQSKILDMMLSNNGTAATGEITIDLPEVEWMSVVGSSTLPSIAVNDSAYFSLRLTPGNDIPLTHYSGNITINCEHGEYVNLPFNIMAVSDSTGTLMVDVTDEYTWNTNGGFGPHLANAEVTLTGYFSLETVAHGYTDENGIFNMEQLPEGYYRLHVEADHHEEYNNIILIEAGTMNEQDIFIPYQAVTYNWIVVPGEVQDEYEFILNTTFETNVPFPVVTIDAPESIPDFEEFYTFNYVITNHGLINTYNIRLHVPEDEDFLFTPNYENVDTLSGLTTIEIPCMVTRLTNNTHICKHLVKSWIEYQYDCGPYFVSKYAHDYTLLGTESCGITPPSGGGQGGFAGGGGGAPGFGGWWWGGGSGHSSLYIHNIPVNTPSGSICVQVGVQFNQQMVMTREAFFGTFNVHNGFDTESLEAIGLNFTVKDEDGNDCTNLFQISTTSLNNITSIDGNGSLAAGLDGMAQILFIPTKEAAPTEPKVYRFGGTFTFFDPYTNNTIVCDLYPVPLTVHPSPDLYIDYFMQRDIIGDDALTLDIVEPSVPAELGVIINNKGAGIAKNVILETAEPVIVENSQGLIIDFSMYGASFNGNAAQLGLMEIPFGNIESGHTAVGEWLFTSSLLGHFVSYEAHVIHNNSYGNPNLSLVSHLDIHELIHPIRAYGNLEDGINDFLVNDVPDSHSYPDSIYFSNGGRTGVSIVSNISFDHYVMPNDTIVTLTVRPSKTGWNYGVVDDPGSDYVFVGCKRNIDNQVIPLHNVWQTFVTLRDGQEPIYENKLHFVDTLSDGHQDYTYTLIYSLNEPTAPCQIDIEDELCEGDDYTMNGFNLTDLSAGTYDETLYVQNTFGYDNIVSLHLVVYEIPEVHIQIDTIHNNGISFRLTATGAEHYEWSTGETSASILVSPTEATTYSVEGTNAHGCSDFAEVTVSGGTGIGENSQSISVDLYPNPVHDKLFVKASEPIMLVEIYTATGNLMYKHANRCNETEISVNDFAPGIYVIRIVSATSTETKRFIVK